MKGGRVYRKDVERARELLSARDLAVLDQVRDLRLMSGAQIQVVHFPILDHASADAAGRACRRVLKRLVREQLLLRLERQIGGIRGGSAGYIYAVSAIGHRLLDGDGPRRRFREPSATFANHTLAIGQLVVDLIDRQRARTIEILRLETEPRCWRRFDAAAGREVLRPDLFVVVGIGDLEYHWFIEMDLGTETWSRRIAKCKQYEAYYRSGIEQAAHDIFPRVLWCMRDETSAEGLRDLVMRTKGLRDEVFTAASRDDLLAALLGDKP